MIALCSRTTQYNHDIILHTYSREPDEIVSALTRWNVIKEIAHPEREIYLKIDGLRIPADLCRDVLAVIEQEPAADVLAAAIDKILLHPDRTAWSNDA